MNNLNLKNLSNRIARHPSRLFLAFTFFLVLGAAIIVAQEPIALPWILMFFSIYGIQAAAFFINRRSAVNLNKKLQKLERTAQETQKYTSTVEFRSRTYTSGATPEQILPSLDKIHDRLTELEHTTGSTDAPSTTHHTNRFHHNNLKPFTTGNLGVPGSSGRLAGSVLPDPRTNQYLNYLLYSSDHTETTPHTSALPSVSLLLGSRLTSQLTEYATITHLRPNQVTIPIDTNYLVLEASVLNQGIWEGSLTSTSTAHFLSFATALRKSKANGLIVIFIDDDPNKANFGYNLMQHADFTIDHNEMNTSFRYWSPDIAFPILDALTPPRKTNH